MIGGFQESFNLMLAGRVIFGIGCENMYVGQSAIISEWFINYELPLIEYIIQLLLFILISLATYFISSIVIDKPAKLLVDQIIFNIKKCNTR